MRDLVRALALLLICLLRAAGAQSLDDLRVGQWVEVKGDLAADGRFLASAIEALPPDARHAVIGTVESVDVARGHFRLLGLEVHVEDEVRWDDGLALAALAGRRVKVEGHYRGGGRFDAREIAGRGAGRDRITGRLDQLAHEDEALHLGVMDFRVVLPRDATLENRAPFRALPLAEEVRFAATQRTRDDEDYVPGSIRLAEGLTLGILFETKFTHEDDYNLQADRPRDTEKTRLTLRPELIWTPGGSFAALFSPRVEWSYRDKENGDDGWDSDVRIKELWGYTRDIGGLGLDLQVGRQDFDDPREWIYKKDLDAARAIWRAYGLRLEVSASTVFGEEEDDFDAEATNWIVYLSNDDARRHLAAWMVDRRAGGDQNSYPIWFGARALGEWLPGTKLWAEGSLLRGYEGDENLSGYGFDLGASWSPAFLEPVYLNLGWAFGSGDDAGSTGTDESYRQTGLERNNGKIGGVTSFRYYGELLDPELSNLSVLTAGIGTRITRDASVDLVFHDYRQDTAAAFLRRSDLDTDPDGVHRHLGRELDLVAGLRDWNRSDFELVLGWFEPGDAFPDGDPAWKVSLQWRFRF